MPPLPVKSPHALPSRLASGGGDVGTPDTLHDAPPPAAARRSSDRPSRPRKTPMSYLVAPADSVAVRSSVTGSPARHEVTPLLTTIRSTLTSFAVQLSSSPRRSA